MADPSPVKFPAPVPSPGDIEVIIVNLVQALQAIETAEVDLVHVRKDDRRKRVEAFAAKASAKPIVPADALTDNNALEASKQTFADQDSALDRWEKEIQYRLEDLVLTNGDQVFEVFRVRLAELHELANKEKADVNDVQQVITDLEHRRDHLKSVHDKPPKKTSGSKGEAS
jgi:Spy/CpxP family protein refolding chaperone